MTDQDRAAQRLREARTRAGYSGGTDAARAFGWVTSTYLGHENGSRGLTREAAIRYARAFGVSWAWLLAGDQNDFSEVTSLLTPIPVVGILDPGAFRSPSFRLPETPKEIFVQVFGYDASEIEAYQVYGARDHHFVLVAKDGTPTLIDGDELLIRRTEGGRVETAAWRLERGKDRTILLPAYAPHVSLAAEDLEIVNSQDTEIRGVVVGELRIKRRVARPVTPDDE